MRADDTRTRGRRDDRRTYRCTPVHPLPSAVSCSLSLSFSLPLEGACCSGSTRLSRTTPAFFLRIYLRDRDVITLPLIMR